MQIGVNATIIEMVRQQHFNRITKNLTLMT